MSCAFNRKKILKIIFYNYISTIISGFEINNR